MMISMDLNASPVPEEDDDPFEGQVEEYNAPRKEEYIAPKEHIESGADIARRVSLHLYSYVFLHPFDNVVVGGLIWI
jgi:hypothetical protein